MGFFCYFNFFMYICNMILRQIDPFGDVIDTIEIPNGRYLIQTDDGDVLLTPSTVYAYDKEKDIIEITIKRLKIYKK